MPSGPPNSMQKSAIWVWQGSCFECGMTASIVSSPASTPAPALPAPAAAVSDGGISFHDLLSIVNPLQHIPIVSTLYRAVTGDTIQPLERIAGDTLYGGFWGFVSSVANVAFQEVTGKDLGDTVLAFVEGDDGTAELAANASSQSAATTATPTTAATASPAATPAAWVASGPPRPLQPSQASIVAGNNTTLANSTLAASPSLPQAATSQPAIAANDNAALALMASMNSKGIDASLSQRALSAYQRSLSASPPTDSTPVF